MADQCVLELQFKGCTVAKDNQFVIIDKTSMDNFLKLKDGLSQYSPGIINFQYMDDEDDIITVDTEEEFKEFAKFAKQRSAKGLLTKVILDSTTTKKTEVKEGQFCKKVNYKKMEGQFISKWASINDEQALKIDKPSTSNESSSANVELSEEMKSKIVSELKEEILSEMSRFMEAKQPKSKTAVSGEEAEEDSDFENVVASFVSRIKTSHKSTKKLEKKERAAESKIDQRLEKLEQKKRKLLEKASMRSADHKPAAEFRFSLPHIMSVMATNYSMTLGKRVTLGKTFQHVWHVINDGTLPWNNVELRHTWSSPGLEPEALAVQCNQLYPKEQSEIAMKFKAPKSLGNFISYWHFFYQVDSQWQQFGHYLSVSGYTKQPKHAEVKKQSANKTLPVAETSADNQPISTKDTFSRETEELDVKIAKHLASAEIAADMAREAANAAFRSAFGKQAAANTIQPPGMNQFEDNNYGKCLNLVDDASDSDTNNAGSDPDFEFVDVPSAFVEEETKPQVHETSEGKDSKSKSETRIDFNSEEIREKEYNKTSDKGLTGMKFVSQNQHVPTVPLINFDPLNGSVSAQGNTASSCAPTERGNGNSGESKPQENPTQQMSFPSLDPSVNLLAFPQVRMIHPVTPLPHLPYRPPYTHSSVQTNYMLPQNTWRAHGFPLQTSTVPSSPGEPSQRPPTMPPQMQQPMYPPTYLQSQFAHAAQYTPMPACVPGQMPYHMPNVNPVNPAPMSNYSRVVNPGNPITVTFSQPSCVDVLNTAKAAEPMPPTPQTVISDSATKTNPTPLSKSADTNSETANNPETVEVLEPKLTEAKEAQPEAKGAQPEIEEKNKKSEPVVQILPQKLVDGAINVAATAYSTAWNAINNLRSSDGKEVEFDPVFENNMALLVEMGFNNLERNARLLKRFNNDISQVIGVICATGGGHNLDID